MAQPPPAPGYGWVKSFEVTPDREIILTCHDPGRPDQDVIIRVLRIELETMLATRPSPPKRQATAPKRRTR